MIKIFDGEKLSVNEILNRGNQSAAGQNVETAVDEIIAAVKCDGDAAVLALEEKFDGVKLASLEVTKEEIDEAYARVDGYFIETLRQAADNIELFHRNQIRQNFEVKKQNGIILGQRFSPIERVGVYVPGGTASYPSTVLMNAIPARLAGVQQIVMVTPPDKQGKINKHILAAAKIAGVSRIFKIGGAQAVAALTYGTESVPKVDKIVGPGNIFVATAKRKVFGLVDIDMIAGPSEILVVADKTANPKFVAADLLSQAEHDRLASAVLVTDSEQLATAVQAEVDTQLKLLPRFEIASESISANGKIIVVKSIDKAIDVSNQIAPEHLELCVDKPFELLEKVKAAGSVFLGHFTPEALGDYFAGTNHTLPTSGTARFSSPLSVDDFVKKSTYLYYPKEAETEVCDRIADFAEREGLSAHAKSATIRKEK